jgi:hypothetical protein
MFLLFQISVLRNIPPIGAEIEVKPYFGIDVKCP